MFTGIIEETGEVLAVADEPEGRRLRLGTTVEGLTRGQSVSVSGACLTVEGHGEGWFEVFLASETVDRTYLGNLGEGDRVNLERALPAEGRLDGHFVQGHVDGTGEVLGIEQVGGVSASTASGGSSDSEESDGDWYFEFSLPEDQAKYVVEKGSIAVDGVSLTVADRREDTFTVAIIPETYEVTTLSEKDVGDPVHLEVDVVAKYVENILEAGMVEELVGSVER
ncbi:MAG: riboflavin synthase [Haloarculaceae archaeon]